MLSSPARLSASLCPVFTRESIRWRSVGPEMVEIAIDVDNPESEATALGDLVIETAALGAFVPFRPVTRVALGSLEPGERRRVKALVRRDVLALPAGLSGSFGAMMAEVLRHSGEKAVPELIDLVQRSEWAGNLNVYFDRKPEAAIEVHRALGLRVKAGTPVAVMVDLPCEAGTVDVALRLPDAGWRAHFLRIFTAMNLVVIQPPAGAGLRGALTIEVTRRSDGIMVPVELTLETVDGSGQGLGCIDVGR